MSALLIRRFEAELRYLAMCAALLRGAVIIVALMAVARPVAGQAQDEAAIRELVQQYTAARNRGDAKALEALFTPDADQLVSSGEWRKGRDAVVKGSLASSQASAGQRTFTVETVRIVSPTVALLDARYEIGAAGGDAPRRMWATWLVVKTGDGWRIGAIRNMLPAPAAAGAPRQDRPDAAGFDALAARIDPYVAKPRLIVLTDIANEPDDQMSLVRLLVYSNQIDLEGLVATTSRHLRKGPRPDVLRAVIDAYAKVQPNLLLHQPGFPTAAALHALVLTGQGDYGMDAVGDGKMTPGAEAIVRAGDAADPRPLWIAVWGGANTLAQALWHVRATRPAADLDRLVSRLRVYTISDQDDAGPWLRREFPTLHYIATPGETADYHSATWTGLAGDDFYRNAPGADPATITEAWVNARIRSKGPLGAYYPLPCCMIEGDTPSFLSLIDNGLVAYMNPSFGGWGGRYVWRQPWLESRPYWTNARNSRDTVTGIDGKSYTSDQATIWRWRTAFMHDFAARMAWTVADVGDGNHHPDVVVNGTPGKAPISIDASVGTPVRLHASGSSDPDGHTLSYSWFFYPEAGDGVPAASGAGGPPTAEASAAPAPAAGSTLVSAIPPAPSGGRPAPPPRVAISDAETPTPTITPNLPGVAHVILAVTDNGNPALTSYRRVILTIRTAPR